LVNTAKSANAASNSATPPTGSPNSSPNGPNEVWCWDITKLMGPTKWSYFYLYVILDIFSRRVVGWCVADAESAVLFRPLFDDAIAKHNVSPGQLTLHADRGGPMKAKATALLLADLGVTRSHNRPHTSNDNPFSESHFKTLKYQPRFPQRFGCIEDAKKLLPPVLRLVQSAASPCRVRLDDTGPAPLRSDRYHSRRTPEHTRSRVPQQPIRQQSTNTAEQTNRRLDQSTSVNAEDRSLNADPGCIKVVDTFRTAIFMDVLGLSGGIMHAWVETLDFRLENTDFPGPDHRLLRPSSRPTLASRGRTRGRRATDALRLACIDDDAQSESTDLVRRAEIDAAILEDAGRGCARRHR
jgi:transposase InsO family protein